MRFKKLSILFIFTVALLFLLICKSSTREGVMQQSRVEISEFITLSGDVVLDEKSQDDLAGRFIDLRDTLIKNFSDKNYEEIGSLLAKKGAVLQGIETRHARHFGGESISDLFKKAKEEKVKRLGDVRIDLSIEVRHIYIEKIQDCEVRDVGTDDEKLADMIAYVIFKYHVIGSGEGEIVHNQTGVGSCEFLHRKVCSWDE